MRQTAFLVVNPITVDNYALLFNCTAVVRASSALFIKLSQEGWGLMLCLWIGSPRFSLTLAGSVCRISQEYYYLFHHSD